MSESSWIQEELAEESHTELPFADTIARDKIVQKLLESIPQYDYPRLGVRERSGDRNKETTFYNEIFNDLPIVCIEGILKCDLNLSEEEVARVLNRKVKIFLPSKPFFPFENTQKLNTGAQLASYFPRIQDGICEETVNGHLNQFDGQESDIRSYMYQILSGNVFKLEKSKDYIELTSDNLELREDFYEVFKHKIIPYMEAHLEILRKIILNIDYSKCKTREEGLELLQYSISKIKYGINYIASHSMVKVENSALSEIHLNSEETTNLLGHLPQNLTVRKFLNRLGGHSELNKQLLQIEDDIFLNISAKALLNRGREVVEKYRLVIIPEVLTQIISRFEYVKFQNETMTALIFGDLGLSNQEQDYYTRYFPHLKNLASFYSDCLEAETGKIFQQAIQKENNRSRVDIHFWDEDSKRAIVHNRNIGKVLGNIKLVVHDPVNRKSIELKINLHRFSADMTKLRIRSERKLLGYKHL